MIIGGNIIAINVTPQIIKKYILFHKKKRKKVHTCILFEHFTSSSITGASKSRYWLSAILNASGY